MNKFQCVAIALFIFSHAIQATCWNTAAKDYDVDPWLLLAIAKVESGMNPYAINRNRDGSYDVGLMQINSSHFSWLARAGINEQQLITRPCISIMVGAAILSKMINVYGNNWEAVGAYNAGLKKERFSQRMVYARKVWSKYQQLKHSAK